MRKLLAVAACVAGGWMFGGCGGGDSSSGSVSDPVELCKQVKGITCDKIFGCFTKDQLDAAKATIGLNATDCRDKLMPPCTPDNSNCNAGETYHADKAQSCMDGMKTLTCTDIMTDPIPSPAACDLVCTK